MRRRSSTCLEGDVAGALFRVPALPPRYVVRDELDGLVGAVVGTAAGGAVGLTGEPAGVGLHGIGGIGKSVLAAALATDDRVRLRFPDGVYWVTVGERPDVLAVQLDLLSRLGVRPEARTRPDATQALRAALADNQVLLVVDDVWSADDAQDFRVTGPRGRFSTPRATRPWSPRPGPRRVGSESSPPPPARALAGEVLGVPAATLPGGRPGVRGVGHVPLAVALLAAAVRGRQEWGQATADPRHGHRGPSGRSWEEIAADLARDADVYGTHPYATTFRALHIAVAALPDDLRAALLGLAVFPPDSAVPVAAIARYWAHTRGRSAEETVADLDRLIAAEVLQRGADTDTIGFHDLAHEYLLLHADALPTLHEQLLDAYRGLLDGPDQWWTLPPDEPYVWEHLAAHLAGAGDRDTLVATVTDPAYQAKRIARGRPARGRGGPRRGRPHRARRSGGRVVAGVARPAAHLLGGALRNVRGRPGSPRRCSPGWRPTRRDPPRCSPARLAPLLPRPYLAVHAGSTPSRAALIRVLAGHTIWRHAVAWSPDGTRLATASFDDGTVRIWDRHHRRDLTPAHRVHRLGARDWPGPPTAPAWPPPARTAPLTSGTPPPANPHPDSPDTPAGCRRWPGHPTAPALPPPATTAPPSIWDADHRRDPHPLTGHTGAVHAVAWSPDGTRLATAGVDGTAHIWDPTTGQYPHRA